MRRIPAVRRSLAAALLVLSAALALAATYRYDAEGRLVEARYGEGKTLAYSYDPAGNLLSVQSGGGNDADGDSLDDDWERRFFGDLTAVDASADPDADGLTAYFEFSFGLDPSAPDPASDWPLAPAGPASARFAYRRAATALRPAYTYEVSGTLTPGQWAPARAGTDYREVSVTPNPDSTETVILEILPSVPDQQFLRVRAAP